LKNDIKTREDVFLLMFSFYSKVRKYETLTPFLTLSKIGMNILIN